MKTTTIFATTIIFFLFLTVSAKQSLKDDKISSKSSGDTTVIAPVDPPIAPTIGFFLKDWKPKTYSVPAFTTTTVPENATAVVTVNPSEVITKIPLAIFAHNTNYWMGHFNNSQFLNQTEDLNPNVIRFPAGSNSDCYFWNRAWGHPPADAPETLVNADGSNSDPYPYLYGKTTSPWGESATVDDYYSLLAKTHSVGILTMNYGYARYGTGLNPVAEAAHLAADWVRYDNGRTLYWEIGNENYADWEYGYRINTKNNKDSQPEYLTGDLYAKHFKIFYDSMKNAANKLGNTIYIGAVQHESAPQAYQPNVTQTWNKGLILGTKNLPDFYIGHNYITPYNANSSAEAVLSNALSAPSEMITYMKSQLQQYGVPEKPIILGEWNMNAVNNYQMVSNTSGSFSVIVQGESIKNLYGMSARWDMYNSFNEGNDMGLYSDGTDIPEWNPRPSFYYMYYFQKFIGDRLVSESLTQGKNIVAYASTYTSGQASVAIVNTSGKTQTVQIKLGNYRMGSRYYWYAMAGGTDNGDFSRKVFVNGSGTNLIAGGPSDYRKIPAYSASTADGIKVTVAPYSTDFVLIDSK